MREIKFRYWNSITNQMVNNPQMPCKEGWTVTQLFSERGWAWMQYTGLKDKNGKEIYEGDIIATRFDKTNQYEAYTELGVVRFESLQWLVTDDKHGKNNRFYSHSEVIGNIYENPELLSQPAV